MRLTTMLLLAAMAGASCTSNAKNNEENNNHDIYTQTSQLRPRNIVASVRFKLL